MPIIPAVNPIGTPVGVPRGPRVSGFENIGKAADLFAGVIDSMRQQEDALWLAKGQSDYLTGLDTLKDEIASQEPDPLKRLETFPKREQQLRQEIEKQAPSGEAKAAFKIRTEVLGARSAIQYKADTLRAWNDQRLANLETLSQDLGTREIAAADPVDAATQRATFEGAVNALTVGPHPGLSKEKAVKIIEKHDLSVLNQRADAMILTNAPTFLEAADSGQFERLGAAEVLKKRETARKKMEQDEARQEKVFKRVQDIAENFWSAQANQGKLSAAAIEDALAGNNPHITPDKARQYKTINDNPPTGAGGDSVQAIMSEYYLGERSLPRIRATRAKLQSLQAQLGRANPLISKAANELQSDQTTMENQAISRDANEIAKQNREIGNLKTTYDAWVDQNPIIKKTIGNVAERDKARIADTYKRQGPEAAKALLDGLIKQKQSQAKAVEQKHGTALNWK